MAIKILAAALAGVVGLLALAGCDQQKISELEEGVSTEADVRARFGEPEKIWDAPDGGRTFDQIVPAKLKSLGVEQRAKSYVEDYTNATAGVMLKRPWAVVRRSGI